MSSITAIRSLAQQLLLILEMKETWHSFNIALRAHVEPNHFLQAARRAACKK